ncbi:hypothetical protein FDW83_01745 [Pseudarthrobacter sp. NamE2]|uniref:hypothetical protein n=1 Tax=Pseudarthrobacter sp. NamE2 TaxID=2576838 RepID=UPI0010FF30BD|nr:hypothetical protein [Pseudarthrobacter sp. NamE2]TLM86497.1 hypothetical protein FDW83_01745 [Pseudarthrobacter sp. NamE2]
MIRLKPALRWAKAGSFVAAATLCLGPPSVAAAAPIDVFEPMVEVVENGQPGLLSLRSSVSPLEIAWLDPGESFSWQIGLNLTGQAAANASLEFIPHGGLTQPDTGYVLTAQRCETQWAGYSGTDSHLSCTSGVKTLMTDVALEHGPTARIPVGDVIAGTSPHILFTLTRPYGSKTADSFTFALGVTVMGEDPTKDSALPKTGIASGGLLAAAAATLGAGFIAVLFSRKAGNK